MPENQEDLAELVDSFLYLHERCVILSDRLHDNLGRKESHARRLMARFPGKAITRGDRVIVPSRLETRLEVYDLVEVLDVNESGDDCGDEPGPSNILAGDRAGLAELSRFAAAGPPNAPIRAVSLARRAVVATGCTIGEAWQIVDDVNRTGFSGDSIAFAEFAASCLERNRIIRLDDGGDLAPSDQFPRVAGNGHVSDPRD